MIKMLNPELLKILACPACHHKVTHNEKENTIICSECQLKYPIKEGIPLMILEEAEALK